MNQKDSDLTCIHSGEAPASINAVSSPGVMPVPEYGGIEVPVGSMIGLPRAKTAN